MSRQKQILVLQVAANAERSTPKGLSAGQRTLAYLFGFPGLIKTVYWLLRLRGFLPSTLAKATQAERGRFVCLAVDSSRLTEVKRALPWLSRQKIGVTLLVRAKELRQRAARAEAERLAELGWEIANAGLTDVDLTEMSSHTQEIEIARSFREFQRHLGFDPAGFAYPFGAYDASAVHFVRNQGFRYALTQTEGINDRTQDPFQLRVICLSRGLRRLGRFLFGRDQARDELTTDELVPSQQAAKSGVGR